MGVDRGSGQVGGSNLRFFGSQWQWSKYLWKCMQVSGSGRVSVGEGGSHESILGN